DKIDAINVTIHNQSLVSGVSEGLRMAAAGLSLGSDIGEKIETGTPREIADSVINESIMAGAMAQGMWSFGQSAVGALPADTSVTATASESGSVTETSTLRPGPYATESVPARGSGRNWNASERNFAAAQGQCHTCGTTSPGTKSGS